MMDWTFERSFRIGFLGGTGIRLDSWSAMCFFPEDRSKVVMTLATSGLPHAISVIVNPVIK